MSSRPFSRVSLLGLLVLVGALGLHVSTFIQGVYAGPDTNLLVFAEASSFSRLDDIDPSGWFYQAVLYNPTDSDIVVTGLRWWYNASVGVDFIDDVRNARCYDSRYFSNLPTVWVSGADDRTRWEYANGTISIIVPAKEIIVTWIEVPTNSRNNQDIPTTYYVETCVGSQWISSPLYVSHSGHDKIASTVFRADFNLTTDPNDEKQNTTKHNLQTPEWLFNEDRSVIANSSTRARVVPVTSSRNTDGIDYAAINVTLPSGWSYVSGSAYNPYGETITPYFVDGRDRLEWDLDKNVYRYSTNQSMAQNYIEFNVTAPYVPGIHNFTVTSITTSLVELWTTLENQYIYAVVKTPPNATFTYSPTTPLTGEDVTFNATASYDIDGQIVNYFWDFGDGNTDAGNIVTHAYLDNGTYTVTLTITDNDGLKDKALDTITVQNRPPIAQFTESAEIVDTDVVIHFNASSSYDLDGAIVNYFWDFGDGTNTTGMIVTHPYADNGIYIVILMVTDDDGATASTNAAKSVLNRPPAANFTESAETVYTGETITFNATNTYDSDGTIVSYFWDFGDGTNATGIIVNHAYLDNGNYTVTLTVTDDDGATASVNATKTVLNRSPIASFTKSATTVYTRETIYFNASDSHDPDGYIVNYFWDFGDGTNATGIAVSHAYVENGSYTVRLTVTDDDGASGISTDVKTILNRAPVASFIIVPQQPIASETTIFNASDSYDLDGSILTYTWNFGDGNITTVTSPTVTHTYKTFGNYSVILNVTDNDNFYNSSTLTLTVHNVDVAIVDVTVSATEVYVGQTLNISVVVRNEGTTNETFNVTLYYDSTAIGTQTVTNLEPGTETTLKFSWDTTDVTPDASYSIKAEAGGVAEETDTTDNTYTFGTVEVRSQISPSPPDWSPILPYLIPILLGGLGFFAAGILRKKRETGEGFEFFNEMTAGGIPDAYSVMIIGGAGSGKSVLCQQLAYEHLTQGKSCVYVTYDIFPSEVRQNMKNFGWDASTYELEGAFILLDCYSSIAGLGSEEKYYVEHPFALSDLGITMSTVMGEVKQKSARVFLDSTAPLFANIDPPKVTKFLQDRGARIKGGNDAFFFNVGKGTIPSGLMSRLEEIVDCIIELDVYKEKGKTWKRMSIRKLRGRRVANVWIPFKIEVKKGITFFPPKSWEKSRKS